MVIAVSVLSGALFVCVALFLLAKLMPPKVANDAYYKRHLDIVEAQLQVFNERMVEERRLASAMEAIAEHLRNSTK
jgi:hypothetical protein